MLAWRVMGAVTVLLAAVPAGWAQSCSLAEAVEANDCFRVELDMKLAGEMRFRKNDQPVSVKLEASAVHAFTERAMIVGPGGLVQKTARVYETAKAAITRGEDRSESTLRPERRLIVAQRWKDQGLTYSPSGALYRPELEVTAGHFDTLCLAGVLPGREVSVGDTWKLASNVVQALCNFEGLTEQNVTGKLESVADGVATFRLTGTAAGIDVGALAKVAIDATGRFDVKAKRLTALEWKQKDERDQGPASPASVVEIAISLKRKAIEQPEELSDVKLVSVPPELEPPASMLQLDYRDPQGRFSLLHGREWYVTAENKEHMIMRLMDRGDFVAQVTITPWKNAGKGQHMKAEEFKEAMHDTAGWEPEKILQAGEVPGGTEGRWTYRLSVLGKMSGVAALQNFYLVAAPTGEQLVVVFSMTPKQADKLGARDLSFVGSLEIPAATGSK
jgi:hypothetical protein